jgi:hypothetical protein
VDGSEDVYVSDYGNQRVEKFAGNGSYLGQWSCNVGGDSGIAPVSIAVSSSRDVYVSGLGGVVEKFGGSGEYLTQWGIYGSVVSFGLEGVAVDNTENYIYVADSFNYRIQVFVNNTTIIPPFVTVPPARQTFPAGAPQGDSGIYTSTNSGATWTLVGSLGAEGVASSADGTKLVAVVDGGGIYISTNAGANWTQATNPPAADWNAVIFKRCLNQLPDLGSREQIHLRRRTERLEFFHLGPASRPPHLAVRT